MWHWSSGFHKLWGLLVSYYIPRTSFPFLPYHFLPSLSMIFCAFYQNHLEVRTLWGNEWSHTLLLISKGFPRFSLAVRLFSDLYTSRGFTSLSAYHPTNMTDVTFRANYHWLGTQIAAYVIATIALSSLAAAHCSVDIRYIFFSVFFVG